MEKRAKEKKWRQESEGLARTWFCGRVASLETDHLRIYIDKE